MSSWQQIQLTTNRTGSWMYYIPLGTRVVSGALLQTMDRTASFYRATRMHSADYAVARCPFVCPSVCPSHSSMLSTPLNIFIFLPSGSPTILVCPYQTVWGTWNARGYESPIHYTDAHFYADPPRGCKPPWLKLTTPDVALMQTPSSGCQPS